MYLDCGIYMYIYMSHLLYSFICGWHLHCFHVFPVAYSAAMNTEGCVCFVLFFTLNFCLFWIYVQELDC